MIKLNQIVRGKMPETEQIKISSGDLELEKRLIRRLKSQGYKVERDVTLKGKSGGEHSFDLLARRDDGFISYSITLGVIIHNNDQEVELGEVFAFDDKCYDCGLQDKVIIALPKLDSVASRFAQSQRMNVLDNEALEALLASPAHIRQVKKDASTSFETKAQFLQSLADLGYEVKERANIKGKSGTEYSFDILAELDEGFIIHRLGIDAVTDGEVSLNQVSLFDTKAYDSGIYQKVILVSGGLSSEAEQFAQQQRIRVIKLGRQAEESPVVEEAPKEIIAQETVPQEPAITEETIAKLNEFTEQRTKQRIEMIKILSQAGKPPVVEEAETANIQSTVEELLATAPKVSGETPKVSKAKIKPEVLQLIPEAMARRFEAMPLAIVDNILQVAMANPSDIFALEALALQSRMRIEPVAAEKREIREAIDFNYKSFGQIEEQISRIPSGIETIDEQALIQAAEDTPVASALRLIIDEASKARASDVHIEPEEDRLRIRYRIDGALQDVMSLPSKIHLPLVSRVKILADMNIADHLRPQDGQFSTESKGKEIDVRVATSPTVHGEMAVLRLLDKSLAIIELSQLGFSPGALARYQDMLKVPFGMILISGPTGAGKTTTLYASVNKLDKISRNIITIEDPVEYRFENMNQIQINPRAGLTFASGLRSILRLDPDVILVGEIRDAETAKIAVQSALTGHLVLCSIHANDAVGVIFRLLDLGIEPFLTSSAVIGVAAQRMVRCLCPDCCSYKEAPLMEQLAYAKETGESRAEFLYGQGCELCSYSGYRGRTGIFEVLPLSDNIRMQILNRTSTTEIRQQAIEEGMVPLIRDGMLKVKQGITTPSEILRSAYFIE
jgi:general secretion pathway protein E